MRSLLLATAGHVNHGKSTLIERLTGNNPDRLPQEKLRGMTLDLGFGHAEGLSFVDCPGHESLTRHTIAGQNGVDGALLVVSINEGVREQTREHARLLAWLGVRGILLVITKLDLISAAENDVLKKNVQKIADDARALFPANTRLDFITTSPRDPIGTLRQKVFEFFKPIAQMKNLSVNRFAVDRAFTLKGIGTVVTGTLTEGPVRKGVRPTVWFSNNKKSREVLIRAIQQVGHQVDQASESGRFALHLDGVKPEELVRGSQLLFGGAPTLSTSLALDLEWALPVKKQFTAILQWATLSVEVNLSLHPRGFWRVRAPYALPLRRGDRVVIRSPHRVTNFGQVIGGGVVLDGQLPEGRVVIAPPREEKEFFSWLKISDAPTLKPETLSWRAGIEMTHAEDVLSHERRVGVSPEIKSGAKITSVDEKNEELSSTQKVLLEFLKKGEWSAFVEKKDFDAAHELTKRKLAHHIRDGHFLHHEHYENLVTWLNVHFSSNQDLTIDGARDFFQTGRKAFLEILEFCDRLQLTFRKDNVRRRFKLPPCSRQEVFPR